jgi:triphosphatase
MSERASTTEIEVKFRAANRAALDAIWALDRFGTLVPRGRRTERQTNRYYERVDGRSLGPASVRWRVVDGARTGTLTLKLPRAQVDGVTERVEHAVELPAEVDPLTLDPTPDPLTRLYQRVGPVQLRTAFETRVERRIVDLRNRGTTIELALDEVHLMGDPDFALYEVEAEIKRGQRESLVAIAAHLEALPGLVRESRSKHQQIIARLESRKRPAS